MDSSQNLLIYKKSQGPEKLKIFMIIKWAILSDHIFSSNVNIYIVSFYGAKYSSRTIENWAETETDREPAI